MMHAIFLRPRPAAQPPRDVAETVEQGMLHDAEVRAMKAAARQIRFIVRSSAV